MPIQVEKINEFIEIIKTVNDKSKSLSKDEQVFNDWKVAFISDEEKPSESGFYGVVLKNGANEFLLAFRGTDFSQPNDVITDLGIGLDHITDQMEEAYQLFVKTKELANLSGASITTLIGHSLGGGLAEFVGALSGVKTYTFNGLGVKHLLDNIDKSVYKMKNPYRRNSYSNIENYISKIDVVGNMFEHCSNNSFYIPRPSELLENNSKLIWIRVELKLIKGLAETSKTIADFINKLEAHNKSIAVSRAMQPQREVFGWILEAHDVENFKNIDVNNYSLDNDLI